jgi:phage shock protein A
MGRAHREELSALRKDLLGAIASEQRLHKLAQVQEREAQRWQARAELAERRALNELARAALQRRNEHRDRAARLNELLRTEGTRIKMLKRHLRDAEAGRSPPPVVALPPVDPVEARLEALQREEHLERDLAELKARLSGSHGTYT